jgi:hypothetical protein
MKYLRGTPIFVQSLNRICYLGKAYSANMSAAGVNRYDATCIYDLCNQQGQRIRDHILDRFIFILEEEIRYDIDKRIRVAPGPSV